MNISSATPATHTTQKQQSSLEVHPTVTATLADVLRPRGKCFQPRTVRPMALDVDAARLVQAAGDKLYALYLDGVTRVRYDPQAPEVFWGAFASTALVEINAVDALEDEQTAAIAVAIFKASGWYATSLRPTLARAQAAITAFVIETARSLRELFRQEQLSFDLA